MIKKTSRMITSILHWEKNKKVLMKYTPHENSRVNSPNIDASIEVIEEHGIGTEMKLLYESLFCI